MKIDTYRKLNTVFWIISSFLMIGMVILYAFLIQAYRTHALYILFIFAIILIGIIYLYDWTYHFMEHKVIGQKIGITDAKQHPKLPTIINLNQHIKRHKNSYYKYDGFKIPETFIKRTRGSKGYLYPVIDPKQIKDEHFEIIENYKYHYFLVRDQLGAYYIAHRNQIK